MIKELSDKELLAVAKKLNIFHPEKMARIELENAIAHITGESVPNKIKSLVKVKKIRQFSWTSLYLISFMVLNIFSIIVPLVLHFVFNGEYYVESFIWQQSIDLSYKIHHLYLLISLNVLSLAWCIYVYVKWIKYGFLNYWIVFMNLMTLGYWIYFLLGLHDNVKDIHQLMDLGRKTVLLSYSPELDHYITAFWSIVGISATFTLIGGCSFIVAIVRGK